MCGPSGTGKSLYVSELLQSRLPARFQSSSINFSATTKAAFVQDEIESHLERVRRGVYGPHGGSTNGDARHLVFVDDFNMPEVERCVGCVGGECTRACRKNRLSPGC